MKSVKFKNETYLDSTSIVHGRKKLSDLLEGTTLYDNSSGTTGTITLNESVANFQRIKIEYKNIRNSFYNTIEIFNPNGKSSVLFSHYNGTYQYLYTAEISISGTSITFNYNQRVNMTNGDVGSDISTDVVLITKVIGFNY